VMSKLTHIDDEGAVRMVDVTEKAVTDRVAVVGGEIAMRSETVRLITIGEMPKGNVLETARIAGIMAAKRTSEWIPLCHPIAITGVDLQFVVKEDRTSWASVRPRDSIKSTLVTSTVDVFSSTMRIASSISIMSIIPSCLFQSWHHIFNI